MAAICAHRTTAVGREAVSERSPRALATLHARPGPNLRATDYDTLVGGQLLGNAFNQRFDTEFACRRYSQPFYFGGKHQRLIGIQVYLVGRVRAPRSDIRFGRLFLRVGQLLLDCLLVEHAPCTVMVVK
jgi:hypothetical protein